MDILPKRNGELTGSEYRERLSTWVSLVSIGGVIILAIIMIWASWTANDKETMKLVFSSVLPLFGAWIGTILAFYYGRENYEAGTRNTIKIAEAVGLERLKEIPVTSKMIARKDMIVCTRSPDNIRLTDIINKLSEIERLPVLNDKNAIIYMIHRSAIDRYLAQKALKSTQVANLQNTTLKNLLEDDSKLKSLFEQSFGFVKASSTLADAKTEMERIPKCQDVFVTQSGNKDEPVIGWITNNLIQENSRI
jgi:hypothetical protein